MIFNEAKIVIFLKSPLFFEQNYQNLQNFLIIEKWRLHNRVAAGKQPVGMLPITRKTVLLVL